MFVAKTVTQWGNSLAVRIPQRIAKQINLKTRTNISFRVSDEGYLMLIPQHKQKYTLDELLEDASPEHFEGEMDWGEPVGREIW